MTPQTTFDFPMSLSEKYRPLRTIEFSSYGLAGEITGLLSTIWERETNGADQPNFQRIAKDSCNNVRDALMTLETEILAA